MHVCIYGRLGTPCVTLVMRELTALTSNREKFVKFVYSVLVEFNHVFFLLCA